MIKHNKFKRLYNIPLVHYATKLISVSVIQQHDN